MFDVVLFAYFYCFYIYLPLLKPMVFDSYEGHVLHVLYLLIVVAYGLLEESLRLLIILDLLILVIRLGDITITVIVNADHCFYGDIKPGYVKPIFLD